MTITADLSAYPLAEETRKYLESIAFGHVIDGELVPSASGATMPIIDPSTGDRDRHRRRRRRRGPRAGRRRGPAAFEDGRWRNLAPLEKERRLRRLSELFADNGAVFGDLDTLDAGCSRLHRRHRAVRRRRPRLLRRLAVEDQRHDPGHLARRRRLRDPRAARRRRHHRALERPGVRHQLRRRRAGVRQLGGAQAGRADADVGDADGPAVPGRRASRRASSTSCTAPARSSAPASSSTATSTPSASPARWRPAGASRPPPPPG